MLGQTQAVRSDRGAVPVKEKLFGSREGVPRTPQHALELHPYTWLRIAHLQTVGRQDCGAKAGVAGGRVRPTSCRGSRALEGSPPTPSSCGRQLPNPAKPYNTYESTFQCINKCCWQLPYPAKTACIESIQAENTSNSLVADALNKEYTCTSIFQWAHGYFLPHLLVRVVQVGHDIEPHHVDPVGYEVQLGHHKESKLGARRYKGDKGDKKGQGKGDGKRR